MTDTAVGGTPRSARTKPDATRHGLIALFIALGFVVGCRLLLYAWMPERATDFDLLYDAAGRLIRGEDPYSVAAQRFAYPLPAVLLAVPFTAIALELARPIFDILVGGAFVYSLWRYRGTTAVLAVVSGAYLFAMAKGQTTPLMVAATLVPALGFLLAVRPNTSAALWIGWPSVRTLLGASLFVGLSFVVLPSWPWEWWLAVPLDHATLLPPVMRPFGFVLLLAALRWRLPEGRLLLAIALLPQSTLPYELVPLALIPANRLEMGLYVVGTWIAVAAAEGTAIGWPVTLGAVYLPMMYLVLRRRGGRSRSGPKVEKDRRRPHRLDDDELKVDVTTDGAGGVVVKVTHLPTGEFASETGKTREIAERKAHDKLAGMLAERRRSPELLP